MDTERKQLPIEVFDRDEFIELSENATECRIKRNPDDIKLKIRTGRYLYTIKLELGDAEAVISRLGCPTLEI
ncbi:50S ribosomal protein L38e [Candidatus Bathyarchaeota archaeon]|nr:50S ribosomal protein L38e [Candidatus Bathyarchaeota archaeon]